MKQAEVTKTPGKARWTRATEWTSDTLTIARDGSARITHTNGGWGGAWDPRSFHSGGTVHLTRVEAAATLEEWGIEDAVLARVQALQAAAPADMD